MKPLEVFLQRQVQVGHGCGVCLAHVPEAEGGRTFSFRFPPDESRSPRQPEQCAALLRIIQGARVGALRAARDQPDFHGIVPPLLSDGYGRILRQRLSHRILQRHLVCIPERCLGLRGGLLRPGQRTAPYAQAADALRAQARKQLRQRLDGVPPAFDA